MPGLPVGGNALLKARAEALKKQDETNIAELRTELAKLGVFVRDTDKRQWWRHVQPADDQKSNHL
ncbi:CysS/YqeB C-terminal domain-containing protein [Actinomadura luteofluorescens]